MLITNTLLCVLILVLIWSTCYIGNKLKLMMKIIQYVEKQHKFSLNSIYGMRNYKYADTDSVKED